MTTYPNITWALFEVCNDNRTESFEDMCRRIFAAEFLGGQGVLHTDHNTPGIEVLPVLEPIRQDGKPQQWISFQAKYTEQGSVDYTQFKESASQTAKHFKGKVDVVYLFSNKTITTTSKMYQQIEKLHSDAGIKTVPVSNKDLLDLVAKHINIVDYFFRRRDVADFIDNAGYTSGLTISNITGNITTSSEEVMEKPANNELLKKLVSEKIKVCKDHLYRMEFDALRNELNKLFSYGIDKINSLDTLYFYKFLVDLHDGKDTSDDIANCGVEFYNDAQWLIGFYSHPRALSTEEFNDHSEVVRLIIVDKLFTSQLWDNIVFLYEQIAVDPASGLFEQLSLHYGLSLYNLQKNDIASEVLHKLYDKTKEQKVLLYALFADIKIENAIFQSGIKGNNSKLADYLDQLTGFKDLKQYKQQELLVASLELESLYYLGFSDKKYPERAIVAYNNYSDEVKSNSIIEFYYALNLELNGERERAISVYEGLNWRAESAIAERYMLCLILNDKHEKTIDIYGELENKSLRTESIYLLALDKNGDTSYTTRLKTVIEEHKASLDELILVFHYLENVNVAKELAIPVLKELISEESLRDLPDYQKTQMLLFLAHCKEIELLESVLHSIEDVSILNNFVVFEVYNALFSVANREYSNNSKPFLQPPDLESADRIADVFLKAEIFKIYFLQIKVLCAGAKQLPYSSLKYSKELFEYTHDSQTARNIVALMFDRNERDFIKYEPYIDVLKESIIPEHSMVVASAMLITGREPEADYYAYRALYLLNGADDYSVFRSYFGMFHYRLHRTGQEEPIRSAKGGYVVTLKEYDAGENAKCIDICLDPEACFSDESNRSMDIEHLSRSSSDYIKICNSGLNQVVKFRGKSYQVVRIMTRNQYGTAYIFRKIGQHPEKFDGTVWTISTEKPEEMIDQIKKLTDRTEELKTLLNSYHFIDNPLGLPIDAVALFDYNRYLDAMRYLLYKSDEALYAGDPIYADETGQKYVPSLSTLVLLGILDRIDVLDALKDDIIIPDSYISFFGDEFDKTLATSQNSKATLVFEDDKTLLLDPDNTIPVIWEKILDFCNNCSKIQITDQERMELHFSDGLTLERVFSGMKINSIQIDALVLAKKENATLVCDDLFFRGISGSLSIRNLNIVSIIQHYLDLDYVVSFIIELSKTNYLFIPIYYRSDEEAKELFDNLLKGEKKRKYYGERIDNYLKFRELFWQSILENAENCK